MIVVRAMKRWLVVVILLSVSGAGARVICTSELESTENHDEELFAYLIASCQFGYTLIGDKPVSIASYYTTLPYENILHRRFIPPIGSWWKDFRNRYTATNDEKYLLLDQPNGLRDGRSLILINRVAFIDLIEQHSSLFAEHLGSDVSASTVIRDVQSGKSLLSDILKNDDLLIGLVLGYGFDNASVFSRWWCLYKALFVEVTVPLALPCATADFLSIEAEELSLRQQLGDFCCPGDRMLLVGPMELRIDRTSSRVQPFRAEYRDLQRELCTKVKNTSYLDLALELLTPTSSDETDLSQEATRRRH